MQVTRDLTSLAQTGTDIRKRGLPNPYRPAELLEVERSHDQLLHVTDGKRGDALELRTEHGARESIAIAPVLDEGFRKGNDLGILLDLVYEDKGISLFERIGRQ